ncbi:MAG: hypothetical protein QOH09_1558 [Pseudonocardiales bacterium]|nr:hypothetical protein [Pseudonocardiales bacterium]
MPTLHVLAVVIGAALVVVTMADVVRRLVIPRARASALSRAVDAVVDGLFQSVVRRLPDYQDKDRVLAGEPAVFLLMRLGVLLLAFEIGYALLLWPWTDGFATALREAGSSLFTLGFVTSPGGVPTVINVLAAATGLVVIALQIAYLPALYAAFNRRETDVTLLSARAGLPPWGPELLLRTRYGVRTRTDDLPQFYAQWERWAADVAESHANYPVLVRFRSPQPLSSWLVALLAVMDSAAMLLALCPSRDRIEPRLAIRMGFTALREIGSAMNISYDPDPDPNGDIGLTFAEFAAAVGQLQTVDFPMERTAAEAWPHFRGWRVNYEALAYELAWRTDAVPAPWSGPRRWPTTPMPVRRPPDRTPDETRATSPNPNDGSPPPQSQTPPQPPRQ